MWRSFALQLVACHRFRGPWEPASGVCPVTDIYYLETTPSADSRSPLHFTHECVRPMDCADRRPSQPEILFLAGVALEDMIALTRCPSFDVSTLSRSYCDATTTYRKSYVAHVHHDRSVRFLRAFNVASDPIGPQDEQ